MKIEISNRMLPQMTGPRGGSPAEGKIGLFDAHAKMHPTDIHEKVSAHITDILIDDTNYGGIAREDRKEAIVNILNTFVLGKKPSQNRKIADHSSTIVDKEYTKNPIENLLLLLDKPEAKTPKFKEFIQAKIEHISEDLKSFKAVVGVASNSIRNTFFLNQEVVNKGGISSLRHSPKTSESVKEVDHSSASAGTELAAKLAARRAKEK